MAAARSNMRSTPRSRAKGGRVILPITVISISGRDDLSAKIFASISLALARSQKRRSTSIVQSSATVFLAVPPSIRPTLVVIPRVRSFKPSIASVISAMARMALRPLSGLPPACAGHPRVRMTKAPTPLRAVPILPPSRAGSFEEGRNPFEHAVDACDVARGAFDLHDAADVGKDGVAVDRVLKKGGHVGPSVGGAVVFQLHQNSAHEFCPRITQSANVVRIWNGLLACVIVLTSASRRSHARFEVCLLR